MTKNLKINDKIVCKYEIDAENNILFIKILFHRFRKEEDAENLYVQNICHVEQQKFKKISYLNI